MSLIGFIARFRCDGCSEVFECTQFDAARKGGEMTLYDLAMETLRDNDHTLSGGPSEQGDHDLCTNCTRYIDAEIENAAPTYEQVNAALNRRAGV